MSPPSPLVVSGTTEGPEAVWLLWSLYHAGAFIVPDGDEHEVGHWFLWQFLAPLLGDLPNEIFRLG